MRTRVSVSPVGALITYSQTLDFDAAVAGSGDPPVQWAVLPVPGSEPGESLGTIDANGLYSPPSPLDPRAASAVLVQAASAGAAIRASSGLEGDFACVTLLGTIVGDPGTSLILPGAGGSGEIPSNVTTALPLVALVLPGPSDLSGSPANVTVSRPPTAIVLPGAGDLVGLLMNVTLAMPPVALVLSGGGDPDVFPPNTKPPVSVDFEDSP